jgi:zinc protease
MKKITTKLVLSVLLFNGLNAQNKPITPSFKTPSALPQINISQLEEVEKRPSKLSIPYKKFKLSNGLTVIIHEDHSDPVVYVDVTYHVGSAREQQGRSGFAHFFEHMMFQGSKHVGDEMHFKYISEAGGELNGTTNLDRTNYFEVVPSNNLEMALWLEADRMGFLLDSVTQQKFEVQRATVKNERGQRYDNAPYGLVYEKTGEALFPQGHPYSWTTIGYIEDLNRVDVNDLKRFYLRWYGPNNAVLTISGDVNTTEALAMVYKYFNDIPAGPEVIKQNPQPSKLDKDRYISYEDNVKFPLVKLSWPTSEVYSKDEAALDALSSILYGDKSSPFYVNFIKNQQASSVSIYNNANELAGQFEIVMRGNKDAKLAELENAIRKTLTDWEAKGISDDEMAKFKASIQSQFYNSLTSVKGKGSRLAAYETFAGSADCIQTDLQRYLDVTKDDIMRVYQKYLKGKPAVILSCVPKGKSELIAAGDNWKMYERKIESESAEYKSLSPRATSEKFNWSVKPATKTRPIVKAPEYWEQKNENGLQVRGSIDKEIPKVNVLLSFKAGHRFENADKSGTAYLLADLINESTQLHSAEEISNMLERMGSSIDVSANSNEINFSVTSLSSNLTATLKIVEEIILKPKFDSTEFNRIKKELLDQVALQNTQATSIANKVFNKLLYGTEHTLSIPVTGTTEQINKINLGDIQKHYESAIVPSAAKLIVVGDYEKNNLLKDIQFLTQWKKASTKTYKAQSVPETGKTTLYFVDKKGAAQSEIRIGKKAFAYDATGDYFNANMANYAFAGNFNSRLNTLLREVKGYTYGVRGRFSGDEYDGNYLISAGVRSNATDSSILFTMDELKKYVEKGINKDELEFTKNGISNAEALKYETPFQKLYFLKQLMDYNLPIDYTAKQNVLLDKMSIEQMIANTKKSFDLNNMIILVVGDKESNFEKIKKLGYNVVELTVDGVKVAE